MDILKAIYEDQQEYEELCKKYKETPKVNGVYGGHRKALLKRGKQVANDALRKFKRAFPEKIGVQSAYIGYETPHICVTATTNNAGRHLKKMLPKEFRGVPIALLGWGVYAKSIR